MASKVCTLAARAERHNSSDQSRAIKSHRWNLEGNSIDRCSQQQQQQSVAAFHKNQQQQQQQQLVAAALTGARSSSSNDQQQQQQQQLMFGCHYAGRSGVVR